MTYHSATPSEPSDRPALIEIRVTSEMVDAGALALASYSSMFESLDEAATRIFRAMISAAIKEALDD